MTAFNHVKKTNFVQSTRGLLLGLMPLAFVTVLAPDVKAVKIVPDPVVGSPNPPFNAGANLGDKIQNGGFTIQGTGVDTPLANGIDEETTWEFDFSGISISGNLSSALLTLELTPFSFFENDVVRIVGLESINVPIPSNLTREVTNTLKLDLLNFYSSSQILDSIKNNNNKLKMLYRDDAIVSKAELEVTSVPEPASTLGVLALGACGVSAILKRKQQQKVQDNDLN